MSQVATNSPTFLDDTRYNQDTALAIDEKRARYHAMIRDAEDGAWEASQQPRFVAEGGNMIPTPEEEREQKYLERKAALLAAMGTVRFEILGALATLEASVPRVTVAPEHIDAATSVGVKYHVIDVQRHEHYVAEVRPSIGTEGGSFSIQSPRHMSLEGEYGTRASDLQHHKDPAETILSFIATGILQARATP